MDMRLNKHEKSNWERAILHNPIEVRIKRYGLEERAPLFYIFYIFYYFIICFQIYFNFTFTLSEKC